MFGCGHIFLNKITVDHVNFGKGLKDLPSLSEGGSTWLWWRWRSCIYQNVVIFWSFAYFASFHEFHDISTDSACPTISHQLLFSWPEGISTPWRFRHYMITTEHWYIHLLKWTQKCRIVFSPVWVYLEIWNQQMFLGIPFLERHKDWERLTQKIEIGWSCLYVLSKIWAISCFYQDFFLYDSKQKLSFQI